MAYRAGQKLGNYQLVRLLGHGGFAEVYLGKHMYLNTQAAIKVLQRQLSEKALKNFLQEARMIAGLKHPHIVRVLEFGIEEQRPFLVMAYAPYGTLRRRYAEGKVLSPALIVPHVRQIADALYYAHERKIIHRDVKPENMLLDDDNTVLLSDFGLAMKERTTYQSMHSIDSAGTRIYMSPEQLQGKPCAASDQYALGVVMYEWLCGCLPFDGPDVSVMVQHLYKPPRPLREHVPELPAEVEAVVLKALQKDPTQRFASVQELSIAFEAVCKDIPVPEDVGVMQGMDISRGESVVFSSAFEFQHGSLSTSVSEDRVQGGGMKPAVSPWPSHYASLNAPSLPASANISTLADSVVAKAPITSSRNKGHISRRTLVAGIAGMGTLVGGVGIWSLLYGGREKTVLLQASGAQQGAGAATSVSTATSQTSPTTGTKGSSSVDSKGTGKNGASNPPVGKNGGATQTPTSSTSGGGNPAIASTPVATPAATTGSTPALSVRLNNPPSVVKNRKTAYISVETSVSNMPFQFVAVYYGLKNQNSQDPAPTDVLNGKTDSSRTATVSWTPSLPLDLIITGTHADIYAVIVDQNGNNVYSLFPKVQIMGLLSGL